MCQVIAAFQQSIEQIQADVGGSGCRIGRACILEQRPLRLQLAHGASRPRSG